MGFVIAQTIYNVSSEAKTQTHNSTLENDSRIKPSHREFFFLIGNQREIFIG